MFKNHWQIGLIFILFCISCRSQKMPNASGFLEGISGVYEGNCMPSPGVEPCKPRLTSLKIHVTKQSENYLSQHLVKTIASDENGQFQTELPIGDYSIFIEDEGEFVCSQLACDTSCICFPIKIVAGESTSIKVYLDHATW
jgi:hypothetical protein